MDSIKNNNRSDSKSILFTLFIVFVISRVIIFVAAGIFKEVCGSHETIIALINQWDAKRYQFIIDNGYTYPLDTDPQANWAFFPMYVIACQFLKLLTFWKIDTYVAGMIVSSICIFTAAFFTVRIIENINITESSSKNGNKRISEAVLVGILMFMFPYTFYCASVYTESMFIMFIALFFYFCQKKEFLKAGFMSAFASATRIVGCTLVVALLVELYIEYRRENKGIKGYIVWGVKSPEKMLSVLLCPLGTFLYMTFLRFFCGDPWAFKNVQIAWREVYYFPVFGVLYKACTGQIEPRYTYMGWFCIAVFAIYIYMFIRKYYSMAVFGIISLLVPLTSHVMSTCRFTAGSFVIYIGLYDLLRKVEKKNRITFYLLLAVFSGIEIFLLFRWFLCDCWLM